MRCLHRKEEKTEFGIEKKNLFVS